MVGCFRLNIVKKGGLEMSCASEDERTHMRMQQPTAMDKHRRYRNCYLLVCFFLLLAQVDALNQNRYHLRMPASGWSSLHQNGEFEDTERGPHEFRRLAASYQNLPERPISFMEEVNVGPSADPLPHEVQSLPTPTFVVKREAFQTGVKIRTDRREMELQIIALGGSNRRGNIPNELGKLPRLQELFLEFNDLIGSIPSSLCNCTSLQYLLLYENSLTGSLSSEISSLSNLSDLWVSNNFLAGPIPISITNLTNLFALGVDLNSFGGRINFQWGIVPLGLLYASGNNFVGCIPKTLPNCSNLIEMWIDDNHLTGEILDSLGNLSPLVYLHVGTNLISGKIPMDLARCDYLSSLDLGSNRLDGLFPPELGSFPSLTRLNLSHNQLTGAIPNSMRNLTQILWLDLSYNQLNGTLSQENLPYLQHVVSINVSHNFLSGSLSASWKNLADIQEIDISGNQISGTIQDLDTLRALRRLDISLNSFSGTIPASLALLPELVFFNASFNNLEGPVPPFNKSGANITTASFLGNAGLCGVLLGPAQECRDNVSSSRASCSFFQCSHTRIALLAAGAGYFVLVCVVVAWAARGTLWRSGKREKKSFENLVNFQTICLGVLAQGHIGYH